MSKALAYVPDWRADETLYSWAAGFHVLGGSGSARETGSVLFGAEHACRECEAPTNLQHLQDVTKGALGDIEFLLLGRSAIGLFVPFLSTHQRSTLVSRLACPEGPGWRTLFGMPASGLDDAKVMRFCQACVTEDLNVWGLPRWRLPHQLAGAWICVDHGLVLQSFHARASVWSLPSLSDSEQNARVPAQNQARSLLLLAKLASRIIGLKVLDVESIRQTVLTGLRDQGVTGWAHPLDSPRLGAWFSDSALAGWLRASSASHRQLAWGRWIHDLLRNRRGDHPLKWMLLWCTLFACDDDEASLNRFIDPESSPRWDASGQGHIFGTSGDALPSDIQRIVADAPTLPDAARSLGLSVSALRRRLTELGTNPRTFRLDHTYDQRRDLASSAIRSYVRGHPECSRSDIHRDCKAAVSWLRAHDPALLSRELGQIDNKWSRQLNLKM